MVDGAVAASGEVADRVLAGDRSAGDADVGHRGAGGHGAEQPDLLDAGGVDVQVVDDVPEALEVSEEGLDHGVGIGGARAEIVGQGGVARAPVQGGELGQGVDQGVGVAVDSQGLARALRRREVEPAGEAAGTEAETHEPAVEGLEHDLARAGNGDR